MKWQQRWLSDNRIARQTVALRLSHVADTVPLMWDHPEFDDAEDDWEPLRHRRARPIRILAILVVIAMVVALIIPVVLRALQDQQPDERPGGVQTAVIADIRS